MGLLFLDNIRAAFDRRAKARKQYTQTKTEFRSTSEQNLQIIRSTSVAGTIFTVPVGKDFYLVNAWVTVTGNNTANGGVSASVVGLDNVIISTRATNVVLASGSPSSSSNSMGFAPGIKFKPNAVITFSLAGVGTGGIIGYLEDTQTI